MPLSAAVSQAVRFIRVDPTNGAAIFNVNSPVNFFSWRVLYVPVTRTATGWTPVLGTAKNSYLREILLRAYAGPPVRVFNLGLMDMHRFSVKRYTRLIRARSHVAFRPVTAAMPLEDLDAIMRNGR